MSRHSYCRLLYIVRYLFYLMTRIYKSESRSVEEELDGRELDITDRIDPKCTTSMNDCQKLLHGLF